MVEIVDLVMLLQTMIEELGWERLALWTVGLVTVARALYRPMLWTLRQGTRLVLAPFRLAPDPLLGAILRALRSEPPEWDAALRTLLAGNVALWFHPDWDQGPATARDLHGLHVTRQNLLDDLSDRQRIAIVRAARQVVRRILESERQLRRDRALLALSGHGEVPLVARMEPGLKRKEG